MAALESLETLDLSHYKCIYISFGSKNQTQVKQFYQDFPYFLEMINKYPLCVISIDDYPEFTSVEHVVPFDMWEAKPRKRYTHVTIPSRSMDKTIRITQQLVELLDKNESAQVFFVNFIKYRNKTAHDAGPEQEALHMLTHLGKYRDHYYDWYGFGLFEDFIIKRPRKHTMLGRIEGLLALKDQPSPRPFVTVLKDDDRLKSTVSDEMYKGLRTYLLDITPQITSDQISLLDPDLAEFSGGRRKRRRRRTRRR